MTILNQLSIFISYAHEDKKWLLILDNADNLDILPPFLPPAPGGHILITTREWAMQGFATRLEVKTLSDEQGAVLLLRRAGLLAPDIEFSQVSPEYCFWSTNWNTDLVNPSVSTSSVT